MSTVLMVLAVIFWIPVYIIGALHDTLVPKPAYQYSEFQDWDKAKAKTAVDTWLNSNAPTLCLCVETLECSSIGTFKYTDVEELSRNFHGRDPAPVVNWVDVKYWLFTTYKNLRLSHERANYQSSKHGYVCVKRDTAFDRLAKEVLSKGIQP